MTTESAITPISIEKKTIAKLRIRILPFLCLLYLVAFLDRINISFAALTMNEELAITSQQFGLLAGIFFFGYFLFEIPSNLLLHKIGARAWIARILISWGIVAMLTAFVHSMHQLYLLRFLLGAAEAGFFPGIVLYLTYWFRQRDQAQTIALFMTALPVASILGAPISGLILDHVHWLGFSSWRWLLILEAVPAIGCGALTYFVLPNRPMDAKFLTLDEKSWIAGELTREELLKGKANQISAIRALGNKRVWSLACIGLTWNIGSYATIFWLPQILKSLPGKYTNTQVGWLVMIPYLVALIAMVLVSRSSDIKLERRFHRAIPMIIGGIALVLMGRIGSPLLVVAFLSVAVAGVYSFCGPFFSLPCEFLTGFSAASGIALINSIANLGGFIGPYTIGVISQRTGSLYGGLALAGVSLFISATLMLVLLKRTETFVH
ncbi:MAG: MFS transporter [Terriglobales bacterium]